MAVSNWPNSDHNSGAVTDVEYEQLVAPYMPNGVIGKPGDSSLVYADSSGRQIKVRANKFATIRGQLFASGSSDTVHAIASNAGATRHDLIVLQWDRASLIADVLVVEGTPGSGPPALTVNTGTTGVYQIALAVVEVRTGVSTIASSDMTQLAYYVAPQEVLCTSTTHPPHAPGLRIYETDTTNEYTSDGAHWINPNEDTNVVGLTVASGWAFTVDRARRINGVVQLVLEIERTGADLPPNTASVMATVPTGFEPALTQPFLAYVDDANLVRGQVTADGRVSVVAYDLLQLITVSSKQVATTGGKLETGMIVVANFSYPIG